MHGFTQFFQNDIYINDNNDKNKMIECAKHGIDLCIIDTTSQTYFKISTSEKFLKIITEIIISRSGEI